MTPCAYRLRPMLIEVLVQRIARVGPFASRSAMA